MSLISMSFLLNGELGEHRFCVCVCLCKCMNDFYRTPSSIMQIFRKCISMFSVIPVSIDKFQTIALSKHEGKKSFQIWNWWVIFGQGISINHVPSCWQNVSISIRRCYRIQTIYSRGYHVPLMTLNSRVQVPWFPPGCDTLIKTGINQLIH